MLEATYTGTRGLGSCKRENGSRHILQEGEDGMRQRRRMQKNRGAYVTDTKMLSPHKKAAYTVSAW